MIVAAHKIAVARRDGKLVYHFGQADRFLIYEVTSAIVSYLETRHTLPACDPDSQTAGHDQIIIKSVDLLTDCKAVLVSRIGPGAAAILKKKGIQPIEVSTFIKEALQEYLAGLG